MVPREETLLTRLGLWPGRFPNLCLFSLAFGGGGWGDGGMWLNSTFFSSEMARPVALLPEKPLASEVRALLNSVTKVIECATGGHGRCVNSVCGCRCHNVAPESSGRACWR
jgi:hypothetical protein